MKRFPSSLLALAIGIVSLAPAARADHRYFVQGYPPFTSEKGESEISTWATALIGQGNGAGAAWQNRAEYEYAISDRLTGAAYLNWSQAAGPGTPQHFDGPSLEAIYSLAAPGKVAFNPALYLEVGESGDALSIYPSLLFGQKYGPWMTGANVIGELETLHRTNPGESATEKVLSLTGGLSRDLGKQVALGFEARLTQVFPGASEHPSALFFGPTLDLDADKVQLLLAWHPQVSGSPVTSHGLNLGEFARSEFRMIISIEL